MGWVRNSVLVVLLGVVVWFFSFQVDIVRVFSLFGHVHVWYVLVVAGLFFLSFVIWNFRWQFAVRSVTHANFWQLFPVLLAGLFINVVTPGAGTASEPLRVYYLCKYTRASATNAFVLTVLEKFFGTVVLGLALIFSVVYASFFFDVNPLVHLIAQGLLVLSLLSVVGILLVVNKISFRKVFFFKVFLRFIYTTRVFKRWIHASSFVQFNRQVNSHIDQGKVVAGAALRDPRFVLCNTLLTLLFVFANFFTLYFSFFAFGMHVSFVQVVMVYTLSTVIADLSFIPGGIGLTEALSVGLLNVFGIPLALATAATLLQRFIYYIFAVGLGYLALVYVSVKGSSR